MFLTSNEPHAPWDKGDASRYPPEELDLPYTWVDTPETRDAYSRYLAETTYFDNQVGQALSLMDKYDLANDTVFIATTEQGSSFPHAKWTLYDAGLHTGFIVRWPGVIEAGSTSDALIEYSDVVPTFVEIAGGKPDPIWDGKSLVPLFRGKTDYHKDYVSKHRGVNADPFEDALNVVIKAKEASELATRAQRDADVISALAEKAQSKAESITRIAVNLSGTAATVASAALRICGYEDFDRAYEMHPTYMDTLTLEELTKLLNTTEELMPLESAEIRLRRSPDLYSQQTNTGSHATAAQNASQSQSSSASESSTTKIRTTRSPTRLKGVQRKGTSTMDGRDLSICRRRKL